MTEPANRYGLPRTIPADVKREVRVRSKFGCVICRKGFFTYEHIDPLFRDAKKHDPDNICCLCWGCQDAVTRKHISKDTVMQAYKRIHAAALEDVAPPFGPLDFNDGNAELRIGSSWHQGYELQSVPNRLKSSLRCEHPRLCARPRESSVAYSATAPPAPAG